MIGADESRADSTVVTGDGLAVEAGRLERFDLTLGRHRIDAVAVRFVALETVRLAVDLVAPLVVADGERSIGALIVTRAEQVELGVQTSLDRRAAVARLS